MSHNPIVDKKRNDLFMKHFGVGDRFFMDEMTSSVFGYYSFDVFKFDDWCHKKHGYTEKQHGSCYDFIALTWGVDVANYVEDLLK